MSNSYYEKGANHYDHHKELHIDTVNGGDIGKLISAFFKDDAEDANVAEEIVDDNPAEGSATNDIAYTLSPLDSIFHKALNLVKVKKAIQDIIIMKGEEGKFRLSVKQTFILHKVLEEIRY